jgi:hypothetical protein
LNKPAAQTVSPKRCRGILAPKRPLHILTPCIDT